MVNAGRHNGESVAPYDYAGPEWMGIADWRTVAETYWVRTLIKPLVFALTQVVLVVNRVSPRFLLNRSFDGSEKCMGWMPGVAGTHTTRVQLPACVAEWTWNEVNSPGAGPVVIYLHGSGFIGLGINSHRPLVSRIARDSGGRALSVGYRLCPRHQVEDGIADGVDAYKYVLDQGVPPGEIVLAGDSAGGYMAAMTAITARDQGLPSPAGCVLIAPSTNSDWGPTYAAAKSMPDAMLPVSFFRMISEVILQRNRTRPPEPSPVDSELNGLCPFLLQVGSREGLRPDAELFANRLAAAGVPVKLQLFDRAVHIFQVGAFYNPDARRAVDQITSFIRSRTRC